MWSSRSGLLKSTLRQNISLVSRQKTDILKCRCLKKLTPDILFGWKLMQHQNKAVDHERERLRIWDHISQIAPGCLGKSQQNHSVPGNLLIPKGCMLTFVRHHMNYQCWFVGPKYLIHRNVWYNFGLQWQRESSGGCWKDNLND